MSKYIEIVSSFIWNVIEIGIKRAEQTRVHWKHNYLIRIIYIVHYQYINVYTFPFSTMQAIYKL